MISAAALTFAALTLVNPSDPFTRERAFSIAQPVLDVVEELGPLFDDDADGSRTAVLLVSIAHHESRYAPSARNPRSGACGILQLMPLWWQGHSCSEIRHDVRLGLRLGMRALRTMRNECGGHAMRWLGSFASGRCSGVPALAREMCGPIAACHWR